MSEKRATEVRYCRNVEDGYPGFYLVDVVTGQPVTAVENVNIDRSRVVPGGLLTFSSLERAKEISAVRGSQGLDTQTKKPDPRVHPPGCYCHYCL